MKKLFSFEGRATRTEYWVSQFIYGVFYTMVLLGAENGNDILTIIGGIALLIGFVPVIAIQVKRFHDLNRSGAFVLINLVPYIGGLWNCVWMGFFGPVDVENVYGENPRNIEG